jgi:hypothetical protein
MEGKNAPGIRDIFNSALYQMNDYNLAEIPFLRQNAIRSLLSYIYIYIYSRPYDFRFHFSVLQFPPFPSHHVFAFASHIHNLQYFTQINDFKMLHKYSL